MANTLIISYITFCLERVTVIGSNLYRLITPEMILQLHALKDHLGLKSFKKLLEV